MTKPGKKTEADKKARILIVEDEVVVAEDIKKRLEDLGYEVAGIEHTGLGAVEAAEKTNPDLVLMDIMLKGDMDGIVTAGVIKDRLKVPVIYLTAFSDNETLSRAKITEPYGYLLKPFEERELHSTIEIALYKHKADQEIKVLQGLIPICSSCKKIRDDKDYWHRIETYIEGHSEAEFTHGYCPRCAADLIEDAGRKARPREEED